MDTSSTPAGSRPSRLVGRDDELDFVRRFFTDASVQGGALVVTGEAGIGKSALLQAVAHDAGQRGCLVLRVTGAQFEADISYSGLNQLLVPLLTHLDSLNEAHREALRVAIGIGAGPAPDRLLVSTATLLLLRQVAAETPVLLVVDDVPWLDRSTAVVLGFLARRLIGSRIGFLAAARTHTESYFERTGLPEYPLAPLTEASALALLRTTHPQLAVTVRRRLVSECRGNPLALVELPALLTQFQQHAESSMPAILPLTDRLKNLFAARVAELPAACRELLLLAALDGTGDLSVIGRAVSRSSFVDDLGPAEQTRVIEIDLAVSRLAFTHPLLASAVVDGATAGQRRTAHRALADVLARHPERRAWHLGEAAAGPDEHVARLLEEAAQLNLAKGDATGAVAALTRSARLSPDSRDRSRRLAEAAYIGADAGGELRNASALLDRAREADPGLRDSLLAAAATAHLLINTDGDVDTAHALVVSAVQAQETGTTDEFALAEALHTLLLLCWYGGRAHLWEPLLEAIEKFGDVVPELLWVCSRTFGDAARTGADALERLDAVLRTVPEETDPTRIIRAGTAAVFPDRLAEVREASWRVIRQGRRGESPARRHLGAIMHVCVEYVQVGRWDEVDALAEEGLGICHEQEYNFFVWYFRYIQAVLAGVRGLADTSRALSEQIMQWAGPRGAQGAAQWATQSRALAALSCGDFEEAYRQSSLLTPPGTLAPFVPVAMWNALDLVESAVRTGRSAQAHEHVAAIKASAMAELSPRLRLLARAAEALVASEEHAAGCFEAALADPEAARWPFNHARVLLLYGEHLRRVRRTAEARAPLSAALTSFRGLGATPWAERAAVGLRAAGESLPPTPGEAADDLLTPQQREIAELAASGLTNKQIGERLFVSPRTVSSHLYQIFPKLGITSRGALRDALAALDERTGSGRSRS